MSYYENVKAEMADINFFYAPSGTSPRQHSKHIDKLLKFKIPKIEQKLLKKYRPYYMENDESNRKKHFDGTQTWIGLHPQVLQTPYSEICHFLSFFTDYKPTTVVDLGAGYGRVGIVLNSIYPEANFIGYEILDVRLNEANRMFDLLELPNCEMRSENILDEDFKLPVADIFFIYDFSNPEDVITILRQFVSKLKNEKFFIVAKGDGIRELIMKKFPEFWEENGYVQRKQFSLFSSFLNLN